MLGKPRFHQALFPHNSRERRRVCNKAEGICIVHTSNICPAFSFLTRNKWFVFVFICMEKVQFKSKTREDGFSPNLEI